MDGSLKNLNEMIHLLSKERHNFFSNRLDNKNKNFKIIRRKFLRNWQVTPLRVKYADETSTIKSRGS